MLRRRQAQHVELAVFRVSPQVLDLPGVVISDGNASSKYTRFAPAPGGLSIVDRDMVFAEYWTHPDDIIAEWRHKSIKCAEVLVPDQVNPNLIVGAYVSCEESAGTIREHFSSVGASLEASIDRHLFFL